MDSARGVALVYFPDIRSRLFEWGPVRTPRFVENGLRDMWL